MFWLLFFCFFQYTFVCASITSTDHNFGANTTGGASAFNESLYALSTPLVQIQFPYFIDSDYTSAILLGSGNITQATGMAVIRTGTTANSIAVLSSRDRVSYKPGEGIVVNCSAVFNNGVANTIQIIGIGNGQDGFFFGYNGTSFGIMYRTSITGSSVDTWTAQASWNVDPLNGSGPSGITLNPQLGNSYRIQFDGLGFGIVNFYVNHPTNGSFILVHRISFLNSRAVPAVTNATMPVVAASANGTGTSDIIIRTAAMMGSVQGQSLIDNNSRYSMSVVDSFAGGSAGALRPILIIFNNASYPVSSSNVNQVMVHPDMLTLQHNSTAAVTFYLFKNPTIVEPSGTINGPGLLGCLTPVSVAYSFPLTFTGVNSNSAITYAATNGGTFSTSCASVTTGNYVSATGTVLYSWTVAPSQDGQIIHLSDLGIRLAPSDVLVVVGQRSGVTATTANVSLSWTESC